MAYYAALVSLVKLLEEEEKKQTVRLSLHEKLGVLQASLEEDYNSSAAADDVLERRIRDVAYQAQDIIESETLISRSRHHYIHSQSQLEEEEEEEEIDDHGGVEGLFCQLISACQNAMCRPQQRHVGKEYDGDLEKVEEEVDSILGEVMAIKKSNKSDHHLLRIINHYSTNIEGSKAAPDATRSTMVGFDEQITKIKHQLFGEPPDLQTIPISGMGGIGKTTLARNIFVDKLIVEKFDIRIWVTISQVYHIQKVLHTILDSINEVTQEIRELSERELSAYIYKHFKGRRYLVIMDDIWSTEVWDEVKRIFPDDRNGSRIVLTTREIEVADYAGTFGSLHKMHLLNEKQSWDLLRDKVFGQEHYPHELEDLGKSIASNCRGLPLAIVVIAGVLSKLSRTRHDWEEIASNVSSVVTNNDEHFSKLLSLSYNHLPHHLKACFLYVGGFPEDYEISASRLIRLWIAEGLLKPIESKTLEEVGDEYLEDLVKRNLILITKKRYNGKLKFCSIHDLLRDLCIKRARYEDFFHVTGENGYIPKGEENIRRACLFSYQLDFNSRRLIRAEYASSHVRSILCFGDYSVDNWGLLGIKRLRVLDALQIRLHYFPDKILELFHLRYLAVYLDPYQSTTLTVSSSISELQNLQTFIVTLGSKHDISLPSQIWKMPQLRHLMIDKMTMSPISFYSSLVGLQYLQTLSTLEDFRFTSKALDMITNLNKLKVRYTDPKSKKWELYCLNNLINLRQLEELKIIFSLFLNPSGEDVNPFPQSFAFPKNLKKLSLEGCRLPWKDLTAVGSLPSLEVLKLHSNSVVGEVWEPIEGEFPLLKFILIEKLDLKYWKAQDTHFPRLEHLRIKECRKLEKIPSEFGDISTLELIELHDCELAVDSAKEIQISQKKVGNDALQVCIYSRTDDL